MTSHGVVFGNGCGICGKLPRTFQQLLQPRRRRNEVSNLFLHQIGPSGPAPGKRCPLDTRLLMGGTQFLATLFLRLVGGSMAV